MRKGWKLYLIGIATLALGLISAPASATQCDFITGGGYIVRPTGEKANFGVGGGCKKGQFWGHLQYIDRSIDPPLKVHWLTILGYRMFSAPGSPGLRQVCGTARTNLPSPFDEVDFLVGMIDVNEPGSEDIFAIRLVKDGMPFYTTEPDLDHTLGGAEPGGGNLKLHKPTNDGLPTEMCRPGT